MDCEPTTLTVTTGTTIVCENCLFPMSNKQNAAHYPADGNGNGPAYYPGNNPKSLAPYKFLMTSQRNNDPKPAAAAGAPGVPGALPLANAGATQNAMGAFSLAGLVALLVQAI